MTDQHEDKTIGLLKQLSIRTGLREKLFHFYGETFQNLHRILETAEEFDFYILMHSTWEMMDSQPDDDKIVIHAHKEIAFNTQIILQEIIDDYWAAYLCFQNGFTKQSQEIFRNTLELVVQIYYLRFVKRSGAKEIDRWVSSTRGIERVAQKIEALKETNIFRRERLHSRLNRLYDLLSTATHSRKDRMTALTLPRMMWAKDMPSFEPSEILYTKGLFFSLLDLELRLILSFIEDGAQSEWTPQLTVILGKMINQTAIYRPTIDKFEKGYLVHREHANIADSLQILYSIRLDGTVEYPVRKKPKLNEQQVKALRIQVQKRLLQDTL